MENYSGPKGWVLLLISKEFFKNKRTADEVFDKLGEENYIYIRQVVQTTLNRLSKPKGPLVKLEEDKKKVYVERK